MQTRGVLSDRNQLRILAIRARAETRVRDLIDEVELPQPLISDHSRKPREVQ